MAEIAHQIDVRGAAWSSQRARETLVNALVHILLILMSIAALIPFWWMLATSFKTEFESFLFPPTWFPIEFTFENYRGILVDLPFAQFFFNSIKIAVLGVVGQLLTSSLAGYAFARLSFPGKNALFAFVLATMMVPGVVMLIPQFVIMHRIGWVNTHLPLIVPPMLGSAFGTFLLRQYMLSLPEELEDAARIDGCNTFGVYYHIALPLMGPALATLGVFSFMGLWNDFMGPLIFLDRLELFTVQLGAALARGFWQTSWPTLMAGSVVVAIPPLLVFLFAQRYFVQGIALTGIKG